VSFDVAADAYDRYMGKYSLLLSPQLAGFAGVGSGQRVLDVGCRPGALTAERETCRAMIRTTPFVVTARAWAARGLA
jgi:hypothetical protein